MYTFGGNGYYPCEKFSVVRRELSFLESRRPDLYCFARATVNTKMYFYFWRISISLTKCQNKHHNIYERHNILLPTDVL